MNAYEVNQTGADEYSNPYIGGDDDEEDEGGYVNGNPEIERVNMPPPPPPPTTGAKEVQAPEIQASPPVQSQNEAGYFAKLPIPLSMITFVTALWLIVGAILDIILSSVSLAGFIIDCYFIFFGLCLLLIVMPTAFKRMTFLERPRSGVEKWTRFLATNWGRGYFMLFVCILAFGSKDFIRITIGIVLVLTGILSIWCGRLAAKKFNRLREYLAAGKEGEERVMSIKNLSRSALIDGAISEDGLRLLVEQSGRTVTGSEVHAIFCFFDRDRTGSVDLKTFIDILVNTEREKSL